MNRIVVIIHPFVVEQEVDIYQNNQCIKTINCPLKELEKICYNLCKEYNTHQLDLKGQHQYALHLRDKLMSTEYSDFDINITIY